MVEIYFYSLREGTFLYTGVTPRHDINQQRTITVINPRIIPLSLSLTNCRVSIKKAPLSGRLWVSTIFKNVWVVFFHLFLQFCV